jgi:hypothetical protein
VKWEREENLKDGEGWRRGRVERQEQFEEGGWAGPGIK